jgi:hypothetical protein
MAFMSAGSGLMHSYHIVAKLRQFRGVFSHQNALCLRRAATFPRQSFAMLVPNVS